ncbi:MAG: OB-fold domain-containing protein, partial [Bacteroidetes bacterium]|nr:OB-fold domain-containing protein [Bacteroidota bacterium]
MSEDTEFLTELYETKPHVHRIAGKCKKCGKYTFPKYLACPFCFSDEIEEAPLSKTGKLHSFTMVRRSMPEFRVPYGLGLVDFPEGVRVMAQIDNDYIEGLELDSDMEVEIGPVRIGKDGEDQ